jgi:hypothetical protein
MDDADGVSAAGGGGGISFPTQRHRHRRHRRTSRWANRSALQMQDRSKNGTSGFILASCKTYHENRASYPISSSKVIHLFIEKSSNSS